MVAISTVKTFHNVDAGISTIYGRIDDIIGCHNVNYEFEIWYDTAIT